MATTKISTFHFLADIFTKPPSFARVPGHGKTTFTAKSVIRAPLQQCGLRWFTIEADLKRPVPRDQNHSSRFTWKIWCNDSSSAFVRDFRRDLTFQFPHQILSDASQCVLPGPAAAADVIRRAQTVEISRPCGAGYSRRKHHGHATSESHASSAETCRRSLRARQFRRGGDCWMPSSARSAAAAVRGIT